MKVIVKHHIILEPSERDLLHKFLSAALENPPKGCDDYGNDSEMFSFDEIDSLEQLRGNLNA